MDITAIMIWLSIGVLAVLGAVCALAIWMNSPEDRVAV